MSIAGEVGLQVVKGHGTENDFVLLPDLDGTLELTPRLVRAICDRHSGVGADGVLRVVRSAHIAEGRADAERAPFFMDYRNADGSIAEMCGNGIRVFARYLRRAGLMAEQQYVGTRGGVRLVRLLDDDRISVEMGPAEVLAGRPAVQAGPMPTPLAATALLIPNPHVVVELDSPELLAGLDLSRPPMVAPALPDGQNVEFVVSVGPRHLQMRVHERGVGETRSCGTGICAAVVATVVAERGRTTTVDPSTGGDGQPWRVDIPGGTCEVNWMPDGEVVLTGPAILVADIALEPDWLAASAC